MALVFQSGLPWSADNLSPNMGYTLKLCEQDNNLGKKTVVRNIYNVTLNRMKMSHSRDPHCPAFDFIYD